MLPFDTLCGFARLAWRLNFKAEGVQPEDSQPTTENGDGTFRQTADFLHLPVVRATRAAKLLPSRAKIFKVWTDDPTTTYALEDCQERSES